MGASQARNGQPGNYNVTPDTRHDGDASGFEFDSKGNVKTNQATALDTVNDAVSSYEKGWTPVNLTASGQILSGPGTIKGFFVNSTTSGTVRISDNTSATTPYLGGAITPAAGNFYQFPASVTTGGYVTITGTIDVTFFVRLGTQA